MSSSSDFEKPKSLSKKEYQSLQNALGRVGITMEQHLKAQETDSKLVIHQIDCFAFDPNTPPQKPDDDNDGWYVGYGVEFHGVGVSKAAAEEIPESSSEENSGRDPESDVDDESSGFDSDPPSEEEEEDIPDDPHFVARPIPSRPVVQLKEESDDSSDKGQLLYGIDEQFYVKKNMPKQNITIHYDDWEQPYETPDFVFSTTRRFDVCKSSETDDESHHPHHDYHPIGSAPFTHSEEDSDDENGSEIHVEPSDDVTSSGLWCNFVISLNELEKPKKAQKLEISEEKSKTIPLDEKKLEEISKAMKGFQLPTPPGWEGVTDSKILDFIKQRC